MLNSQEVLRGEFNFKTHKETFINYLEVIIDESGTIMYAVPSHQDKMIDIALEKLNITKDELFEMCPIFPLYLSCVN